NSKGSYVSSYKLSIVEIRTFFIYRQNLYLQNIFSLSYSNFHKYCNSIFFIRKAFNYNVLIWQLITFDLIIFIFWRGYFNFPLTDFYSIFILIAALRFRIASRSSYYCIAGILF